MPAASKKSKSSRTNAPTSSSSRSVGARARTAARPSRVGTGGVRRPTIADHTSYVYAYCAVSPPVSRRLLSKLPTLPDGAAPRALSLTDALDLIVADVPADVYAADKLKAQLGDIDWVGRCGSAHHAVADALVDKHTVVPLRPFTLFSSETRARQAFTRLAGQLAEATERVADKAEWVVRIGKPDPVRMATPGRSGRDQRPLSGAAFLAEKAAAKRRLADLAVRVREESVALYETLAAIADQAERRPADTAPSLLLDAAFLVATRQTGRFKRTAEKEAQRLLDAGCRVTVTGPWPPYSFVGLDAGAPRE